MQFILRWLVIALTIIATTYIVPGVHVDQFGAALAAAAVLAVFNIFLKPLLILLTLPITVLSLGLFLFFINAVVFQLVGAIVYGFRIDSFESALVASVIVSLVTWAFNLSVRTEGKRRILYVKRTRR